IMSGATIGIDRATTKVVDGEVYALEHEGMLRVKYLYRLPGGGLRLRSFNREEHADEDYGPEHVRDDHIRIIGWVFWWSTVRNRGAFK
ncbi:S24 family peptidase, partial [Pseudomonas aeruginosa]